MAGLSTAAKNKITELLNTPYFAQHRFTVKYDDENNPIASIAFPASPECQFVISSTGEVNVFITTECPGIHSDAAETLQRSSLELCIAAIQDWAERIIDRQKDWIMDEFGGVADSNPSY